MTLGPPSKRNEPLHVGWMALALVAAAVFGAALGLVWQSLGAAVEDEAEAAPEDG